jgi:lysozyme family protein
MPDEKPDDRRRTRADYERGLPGYHDPTAGVGGSSPARSALTLRAALAAFGLVVSAGGAWFAFGAGLTPLAWALVVVAVIALADLVWVLYRKQRGEPG